MDRPAARIVKGSTRTGSGSITRERDPLPIPSLLADDDFELAPHARGRGGTGGDSGDSSVSNNGSVKARRRLSTAMPMRVLQSSRDSVPVAANNQRRARAGSGAAVAAEAEIVEPMRTGQATTMKSSVHAGGLERAGPSSFASRRRSLANSALPSMSASRGVTSAAAARADVALRPISSNTIDTRNLLTARGSIAAKKPTSSMQSFESSRASSICEQVMQPSGAGNRQLRPAETEVQVVVDKTYTYSAGKNVLPGAFGPFETVATVMGHDTKVNSAQNIAVDHSCVGKEEAPLSSSLEPSSALPVVSSTSSVPDDQHTTDTEQYQANQLVDLVASMTGNAVVLKRENKQLALELKDALREAQKASAAEARLAEVVAEQTKALLEQRKVIKQTSDAVKRLQAAIRNN